jgi:hypothetical protein
MPKSVPKFCDAGTSTAGDDIILILGTYLQEKRRGDEPSIMPDHSE